MRQILSIFFAYVCALFPCQAFADSIPEQIDFYAGPRPIAVLIESDPWADVIGYDAPRLVIYEDGQYIRQIITKKHGYHYVVDTLSNSRFAEVKASLFSLLPPDSTARYYDLARNVTDQPETMIYLDLAGRQFGTIVRAWATYEYLADRSREIVNELGQRFFAPVSDSLPAPILELYQYCDTLQSHDTVSWIPQYVEVLIWPYENAPQKSILWPKEWPGLESPYTLSKYSPFTGQGYTIYLPGSEFEKLREFLRSRREKGAIEVEGKKFTADIRYCFPNQQIWRNALLNVPRHEIK